MIGQQLSLPFAWITCCSAIILLKPSLSFAQENSAASLQNPSSPLEISQPKQVIRPVPPPPIQQPLQTIQLTQAELQELLLLLQAIQQADLRPNESGQIQTLIAELESLQTQGQAEVEISARQAQQIQTLLESLTDEELEQLTQLLPVSPAGVFLTQGELQELLALLEGIQQLRLRPQQSQDIETLIAELRQLEMSGQPQVELSTEQAQQVQTLIESLTPEERDRLSEAIALPEPIPDNRFTQAELQEAIFLLQAIQQLNFRPQQNQEIQTLIDELVQLQAQGQGEIELPTEQFEQLQGLLRSLTPEEVAQLDELGQSIERLQTEGLTLTQAELADLVALLEAAESLNLEPEQAEQLATSLARLRSLQAEGQPQVSLSVAEFQTLQALINSFTQRQIQKLARSLGVAGATPSISVLTPIGFGGGWGSASLGLSFQNRTRFTENADGSVAASIGFGDPVKVVGVDATVGIYGLSDTSGAQDNFGAGSISLQVSRQLPNNFSVAVGVENLIEWPDGAGDSGTSTYLVGSKIFQLDQDLTQPFSLAFLSLGVGNGRFRPESDFDPNDDGSQINLFGSVATQLTPGLNGIVEWTGQDLTLGLSMVPFKRVPLVITPALVDVTGNAGDGARFTLGLGYSISF